MLNHSKRPSHLTQTQSIFWKTTPVHVTDRSSVNELLNDVCPLDHGILPQYITHNPESGPVEQPDAFLYPLSIF